jgi:hypothetical protein
MGEHVSTPRLQIEPGDIHTQFLKFSYCWIIQVNDNRHNFLKFM